MELEIICISLFYNPECISLQEQKKLSSLGALDYALFHQTKLQIPCWHEFFRQFFSFHFFGQYSSSSSRKFSPRFTMMLDVRMEAFCS